MKKIKPILLLCFVGLISTTAIFSQTGTIPTGSDTSCRNGISLFQKIYGGTKEDFGLDIAAAADSGYVIAGYTNSFGNGGSDGLITKVNKNGNVLWSKAVGGSGDDLLYRIEKTSDGGFIASGQTKSYGNAAGDAWLVKLDASGNIQWSKKYGDGNVNGESGFGVTQLSDGGYAFAGTHKYTPGLADGFVVRTDSQGNVIWSKSYGNWNSDQCQGIVEDGNSLVVTGFYYAASFYDGYVMKLDKSNGAVQWIKGYDAENRSTWMFKIAKTSTGYQVASLLHDDFTGQNQQECIWNLNTDGSVQNVKKLVIPGTWSISYGWYSLGDGGFIAANGENNNGSDIIVCRVNGDGSLGYAKKYTRPGKQGIYGITAGSEGGHGLVGNNTNAPSIVDSNNVYLMKIDNVGNAGSCSGINTTDLTVVSPSYTTPVPDVAPIGNITINNPIITVGVVNFTPATSAICYSCGAPSTNSGGNPTGSDTSCTNGIALFQRHYYGNKADFGQSAVATADSGWVVAGYTNSYGAGGSDGQVMRLNKRGQIIWSKAIGGSLDDAFYKIRSTADGGYIAVGLTKSYGGASNGSAWMVKLDANGVVQWSRRYDDGNTSGSIALDVTQTSDGGYAVAGTNQATPGLANGMVIKTDNNGNVSWSKSFNSANSDQATGILEDAGNLVVSAFQYGQSSSYYDGVIMKLDLSTGNIIWARNYEIEGKSNWFASVSKRNGGYGIYCYNSDDFVNTNPSQVAVNVDSQGLPVELRKVTASPARDIGAFTFTADEGFIVTQMDLNTTSDVYIGKVSSSGVLQWTRKVGGSGIQRIVDARQAADGGFLLVGSNNGTPAIADSSDLFLIRTDSTGNTPGCTMDSTSFQVSTPPYSLNSNFNWSSVTNITYSIATSVTVTSTNINPGIRTLCSSCITPVPVDTSCTNGVALFQRHYYGNKADVGQSAVATADSGWVVAGYTNSYGSGGTDGQVMRLNMRGQIMWSKAIG